MGIRRSVFGVFAFVSILLYGWRADHWMVFTICRVYSIALTCMQIIWSLRGIGYGLRYDKLLYYGQGFSTI